MCTDEGGKVLSNVVSVSRRNTFHCPRHAVPSAEYLPLQMPGHPPSPSLCIGVKCAHRGRMLVDEGVIAVGRAHEAFRRVTQMPMQCDCVEIEGSQRLQRTEFSASGGAPVSASYQIGGKLVGR